MIYQEVQIESAEMPVEAFRLKSGGPMPFQAWLQPRPSWWRPYFSQEIEVS